ncbi:hypothetical protein M0657_012142 [Pyricularia oryzae]|nr:hypothetical protein M0657_012142 [Pyricularia oryzae]
MFITTLLNVLRTASTSTRDQVLPVLRVYIRPLIRVANICKLKYGWRVVKM